MSALRQPGANDNDGVPTLSVNEVRASAPPSRRGGSGGTPPTMEEIEKRLKAHEARFDGLERSRDRQSLSLRNINRQLALGNARLKLVENGISQIANELSSTKFWFAGTVGAIILAGLGLVYAARQDTTATVSTALTAIQTALAAKPTEPLAQQPQPAPIVIPPPTVILVPTPGQQSIQVQPQQPQAPLDKPKP